MTMFNKDQIFQLLESRDGEALRALWQGRGAVDIAALLDSVEDGARQAAVFRTLPKDLAADVFSYLPGPTQATLARSFADGELQQIAEQTALYKQLRPLVQQGKFYRLLSPFAGNQTAWMTVSQDGSEFAVWYYKDFCQPEEAYINVRLTGLEQTARYQDEDGSCYTGEMLMNLGLPLRWKNGDYFSQMWHFKRL